MSTPVHRAIAALPVPGEWTWQVVVRPRRRTLGIEVTDDGDVLFAVPPDADPAAVARAVRTRLPRLAREVRRRRTRPAEPVKELIGGTGFAYLGRRHRLRLLPPEEASRVRLHRGWLELPRPRTTDEGAHRIAQWYEVCGTRWLSGRLPSYASRVGLPTPQVEAGDLGPRWGALRPDGAITVHWAVLQLPPSLVDLVLVHELCHLRAAGHGAAFRREVRLVLPDADAREKQFAEVEPELWRGAVR
ncbi:YgjP-like metallopeptidase domain-containing protein [Streptomyces sp. ML-6]|uniref:M48 family metallopeptidase n=1 Tax=Streptomyces sp. ML-6 TaxID=2982693 RepID=UPI0024BF9174|nr:YgjP-like metallopeptidase domain-containing protein [Streptomyces sp. ML-6]MDK0522411.1 M48 family metallopeptidase [Streptomyces sp. ML-6]